MAASPRKSALEMDGRDLSESLLGGNRLSGSGPVADDDEPRRPVVSPNKALLSLGLSLLAGVLLVVGFVLLGRPFASDCHPIADRCGYTGCFSGAQFFGLVLVFLSLPLVLVPLGTYAQGIISWYRDGSISLDAAQAHLWCLVGAMLTATLLAAVFLVKPWTIYTGYGHGWSKYGLWQLFFGGFLVVLFPALGCVFAVSAMRLRRVSAGWTSRKLTVARMEPDSYADNACRIWLVLLFIGLSATATSCFSAVFNYSPAGQGSDGYFQTRSPYSLPTHRWSADFVPKVYVDTLVFYMLMAVLVVVGCVIHFHEPLHRLLHHRLRVPFPRSAFNPFPTGVSVGEVVVVACVAGLYLFWFLYFRYPFDYIVNEVKNSEQDVHADAQIWARVWGQVCNLSFALLLLPATRNSVWESVFGIPFERAIKYHRGLGAVAFFSVTVHMMIWSIKWAFEGNFWHNFVDFQELRVQTSTYQPLGPWPGSTPGTVTYNCTGATPHWDNPTIVVNYFAYMVLCFMIFVAVFCRRKNYELFHYAHHFAWFYYLIALCHAWSFWYYACFGLSLYTLDRCIRLTRSLTTTSKVSLDVTDGVTRLRLGGTPLKFFAGQYAFVNIPAVSNTEWHPFTISSAPSSSELTFHIKNMGHGTWTDKLAALAEAHAMTEVRVDGPYGRPAYLGSRQALLLIAGGIGVTPMHATFAELYHRYSQRAGGGGLNSGSGRAAFGKGGLSSGGGVSGGGGGSGPGGSEMGQPASLGGASTSSDMPLEHVHLVWCTRSDAMFGLFAPTIHKVSRHNPRDTFHVSLYNTRHQGGAVRESSIADVSHDALEYTETIVQRGRPHLDSIFTQLAADYDPRDVMVMVCGPPPMVHSASELCFQFGFAFHTEIFCF